MERTIWKIVAEIEQYPIESGGHLYHPIPFPEFAHLTTSSSQGAAFEKWKKIQDICKQIFPSYEQLKVLDIGANAGFYTFSLAKKGAIVTAFEPHKRYKTIGKEIAAVKLLNVNWRGEAFHSGSKLEEPNYDLCLCLSTYQWMAGGGAHLSEARKSLRKLSEVSTYMLFELGFNKGSSHLKTKRLNHYSYLIDHLSATTRYQHFKLLGITRVWKKSRRYLVLCSQDSALDDGLLLKLWRRIRL